MRASPRTGELLTNGKGTAARIRRPALEELAERLPTRDGKRPRADRLDRDDRALSWCIRKANAEGNPFRSTIAQAAAGMGYPVTGDREDDFRRFESSVRRALDSLQDAGLLRWGGIRRDNGQWWCIEVELGDLRAIRHGKAPDNGCQPGRSRRWVPRRRPLQRHQRRRPHRTASVRRIFFISTEVGSPFGDVPSLRSGTSRGVVARARGAPPPSPIRVGGDDGEWGGEGPGGSEGPPERRRLIEAFEATYDRPARFSHRRWGPVLDRALRRLDRYADFGDGRPGAGLEHALGLIRGHAELAPLDGSEPPASLAYFVPILDAISKDWRRAHKPRLKAERRRGRAARAPENAERPRGALHNGQAGPGG